MVVQSEIERYPGRAAGTVGGTFLATFDGPARAIRCASAIVDGARLLGIELRAGLHTGECNVVDGELTGLPIGAAAWVMGQAAPGEILASRTVRDLVGGSSIEFEERDPHLVDAAPGPWRVFRVGRLPRLPGSLVPARAPAPAARGGSVHPLTRREREVAVRLARGLTNRQIADDLVAERTRAQNRLRWHLHELEPGWEIRPRYLDRRSVLANIEQRLDCQRGTVARIAREIVGRIRELSTVIGDLQREIARLVAPLAPSLLAMKGCGALTAAKLIGETAGVRRRSRAAFAKHTGTAPIPVWSGNTRRHRLNRGGNRQLNLALHRIAITQLRQEGTSRGYVQRRMACGDTKTEAVRALRRRLSDEVYRRLRADELARSGHTPLNTGTHVDDRPYAHRSRELIEPVCP